MHVLPFDVAWIDWSFQTEVGYLFTLRGFLVSFGRNLKNLLYFFDVIVSFISDEGCHYISLVLEFLLILNFVFVLLKLLIVLNFDCVSSLLQKINHFLAIEDKVNASNVNSLNSKFLLEILLEEQAPRQSIGLIQFVLIHQLKLLSVPCSHIDFDVVVRSSQVQLIISFAQSFGVQLVNHEENKG